MGCGGGKLSVDASMQKTSAIIAANPLRGLRVLTGALEQHASPGEEESIKKKIPEIFELLPKAIGGLNVKDRQAIVSASAVIELCVKLVNDPSVGDRSPTIDPENIKQCINHLSSLLRQAQIQGHKSWRSDFVDDHDSSAVARAIARAIRFLFQLEDHAAACRQEVAKCGSTLRVAVSCVKTHSGLTPTAKTALLTMFAALLEEPESAQELIDNQGIYVLLPYCIEPSMCGASKEFQLLCTELLENCIKNGHRIKNKADVEAAIEKAKNRSHWDPKCRGERRLINSKSGNELHKQS